MFDSFGIYAHRNRRFFGCAWGPPQTTVNTYSLSYRAAASGLLRVSCHKIQRTEVFFGGVGRFGIDNNYGREGVEHIYVFLYIFPSDSVCQSLIILAGFAVAKQPVAEIAFANLYNLQDFRRFLFKNANKPNPKPKKKSGQIINTHTYKARI